MKSADDEKEILRGWVREQIGNKMCFYGKQVFQFNFDPRSMAEDLGDDVVKANTYGLKNLKYVAANFVDWMAVNDEGYAAVESTYKAVSYTHLLQRLSEIGNLYGFWTEWFCRTRCPWMPQN